MADMSEYEIVNQKELYREVIEDLQDIILPQLRHVEVEEQGNLWEHIAMAADKLKDLYTNRYQMHLIRNISQGANYEGNDEIYSSVYGDDDV